MGTNVASYRTCPTCRHEHPPTDVCPSCAVDPTPPPEPSVLELLEEAKIRLSRIIPLAAGIETLARVVGKISGLTIVELSILETIRRDVVAVLESVDYALDILKNQ